MQQDDYIYWNYRQMVVMTSRGLYMTALVANNADVLLRDF